MLSLTRPAVILAPMEGVTDAPMRAVLSAAGGFTHCVSEFVRVSHSVLRAGVFRKRVPEVVNGAVTPTGLPVQVQLLGGDPDRMAESAVNAITAGATAIDLNFGCPAPTVNRHDGGASLLKDPPRVRAVVAAVRQAVPAHIPVSAKLRLGWDRTDTIFETSALAAEGGASWITIHARTRMQGYAPPVKWELIGQVRERLGLPVVANGDIGSVADLRRCRDVTGCVHFMLGRGAVADPGLAGRVAAELGLAGEPNPHPPRWPVLLRKLPIHDPCGGGVKRLKQWLRLAAAYGTFAHFDAIKRATTAAELLAVVDSVSGEERDLTPRPPLHAMERGCST
jgi:tRNA-dihydrouridine synthase C